jgi:hypothetical protein
MPRPLARAWPRHSKAAPAPVSSLNRQVEEFPRVENRDFFPTMSQNPRDGLARFSLCFAICNCDV